MRSLVILLAIAVIGVVFAGWTVVNGHRLPPVAEPVVAPATSTFAATVAGAGLVEPATEAIAIGSPVGDVVAEVLVAPGSSVKAGDPLLRLDDRAVRAQEAVQAAALATGDAAIRVAQAELANAQDRVARATGDFISAEEKANRGFAVATADALLVQARAAAEQARAQLAAARTEIDRRTVRAPVDGTVLRVDARQGEFAPAGRLDPPLLVMGDVDHLRIRVDIDENDAWRVAPGARAEGAVRGNPSLRTPLKFVRIEPYVVPKRSLTGLSAERVDTRVLQVIYAIERSDLRIYAGQQMDVFIDAP